MKKNFFEFLNEYDPDILCLQETKMQEGQAEVLTPGYHQFWCSAERKGYSGTLVLSKTEPLWVDYGIGVERHDKEGRVITAEYSDFYLVCVYVPNSQDELARLDYRMDWEDEFRKYVKGLEKTGPAGREGKPVVICGDMNVAHKEIDLKNPSSNHRHAGFTDEERGKLTDLLGSGFVDTFRYFHPDEKDRYSWWSYRFNARSRNAGWRIDYFLVSESLTERLKDASILDHIMGSDHCPVSIDLE